MARPLSDEKRQALLAAAADVVARRGVGASTSAIARKAAVAEGTLFTYFATKKALLNALYVWLKADLRDAMLGELPAGASIRGQTRHVWTRYVRWADGRPGHRAALRQLSVSDLITPAARRQAGEGFEAFHALAGQWTGLSHGNGPTATRAFAAALLSGMAETTLDFAARDPDHAEAVIKAGFEAFWRAVAPRTKP